jgi:hypothetical protein
MSIAIRIHNDFATFENSISKRQLQYVVTAGLKVVDSGGGNGVLHVNLGQVELNADRVFELSGTLAECEAAFEALAEYNELRVAEAHVNATLWDVDSTDPTRPILTYPKA